MRLRPRYHGLGLYSLFCVAVVVLLEAAPVDLAQVGKLAAARRTLNLLARKETSANLQPLQWPERHVAIVERGTPWIG